MTSELMHSRQMAFDLLDQMARHNVEAGRVDYLVSVDNHGEQAAVRIAGRPLGYLVGWHTVYHMLWAMMAQQQDGAAKAEALEAAGRLSEEMDSFCEVDE